MANDRDIWIKRVFKGENGVLFCEYSENDEEKVARFTKKILSSALAHSIFRLEEYETLLGVKVENIDDFLKASWLACFLFGAFNVPYSHPTSEEEKNKMMSGIPIYFDENLNERQIYFDGDIKKASELYEIYGKDMMTAEDFYDWCGNERLGILWEDGQERMGICLDNLFGDSSDPNSLTERDLIAITPKYKTAVVSVIMADIMDDAVRVLNNNWLGSNDLRPTMALEDFLNLPEE